MEKPASSGSFDAREGLPSPVGRGVGAEECLSLAGVFDPERLLTLVLSLQSLLRWKRGRIERPAVLAAGSSPAVPGSGALLLFCPGFGGGGHFSVHCYESCRHRSTTPVICPARPLNESVNVGYYWRWRKERESNPSKAVSHPRRLLRPSQSPECRTPSVINTPQSTCTSNDEKEHNFGGPGDWNVVLLLD